MSRVPHLPVQRNLREPLSNCAHRCEQFNERLRNSPSGPQQTGTQCAGLRAATSWRRRRGKSDRALASCGLPRPRRQDAHATDRGCDGRIACASSRLSSSVRATATRRRGRSESGGTCPDPGRTRSNGRIAGAFAGETRASSRRSRASALAWSKRARMSRSNGFRSTRVDPASLRPPAPPAYKRQPAHRKESA